MTEESASMDRPEGIDCVGVIGAGQMGNGIAHVFALAGVLPIEIATSLTAR